MAPPLTTVAWDNAVQREAAWFTTDTLSTFPGVPPLQAANGGPFQSLQAWRPNVRARNASLYLFRLGSSMLDEDRMSMGGIKEWRHAFCVLIQWPMGSSMTRTGTLEDEQIALDGAVAAVLTRIRGPLTDKTHAIPTVSAGFNEVGDSDPIHVEFAEPDTDVRGGRALEVRVMYSASDTFVA